MTKVTRESSQAVNLLSRASKARRRTQDYLIRENVDEGIQNGIFVAYNPRFFFLLTGHRSRLLSDDMPVCLRLCPPPPPSSFAGAANHVWFDRMVSQGNRRRVPDFGYRRCVGCDGQPGDRQLLADGGKVKLL